MAHRHKKKSSSIPWPLYGTIVAIVALYLLLERVLGFRVALPFAIPVIGSGTDISGWILGAIAFIAGGIWLISRRSGGRHRWSAEVLGIRSLKDIYAMSPGKFEEFVAFLFKHRGYDVQVVGHSGDEGIDIELRQHTLHGQVRSVAQCKRYQGSVGQPIVREFYGSFANQAAEGYLVTTGTFTQPAIEWAQSRPIKLIDGAALMQWTEETAHQIHGENPLQRIFTTA